MTSADDWSIYFLYPIPSPFPENKPNTRKEDNQFEIKQTPAV